MYNEDMIRAVFFDYDGVLSKRFESAYRLYHDIIRQIFPEADLLETEEIVQKCMYWDQSGNVGKRFVMDLVKKNHAPDMDAKYWSDYWYDHFHEYQIPMDDVYEVLDELRKRYRIGIISNGSGASQRRKINALHLEEHADSIIVCGEIGKQKPDPAVFRYAAKRFGLQCSECAMIGDTFQTDIIGALKAGMMPVWYCWEKRGITDLDIIQVSSMQEIRQMFTEGKLWTE